MMNANPQRLRAWRTVDTAADPHEFTRYLEQSSEHPLVREFNRARLTEANLQPGSTVLDLGCGIGSDTLMLAEAVGPTGRVHAVDRSSTMIEAAARRAAQRGLTITCQESDAASLPFPDRTFDLVWLERVLMHVVSPRDVMVEIHRVLRDGGQIVAHEPDSDGTMVSDGGDPELARLLEHRWSAGVAHPRVGRALEGYAHEAGFTDVRGKPDIAAIKDFELACAALRWRDVLASLVDDRMVSKHRADAWLRTVEAEAQGGRVICWSTRFSVFARR